MDHENAPRGGPELGMYACDQELFERIWKRVMPEEEPGCPISVIRPVPEAVHTPAQAAPGGNGPAPACGVRTCGADIEPAAGADEAADASQGQEAEHPSLLPPLPGLDVPEPEAPDVPEASETPGGGEEAASPAQGPEADVSGEAKPSQAPSGDDFPPEDAVPCLGSASSGHGTQLQEDILSALEGWQFYRHLARKVTGPAARTLSALASEKHKQARRLAAAYFLISGVRYWPTDRLGTPQTASWLGALRRRFAGEQQLDSRWRAASLDTEDGCLADLYGELAEECAAHAGVLRTLLENAL